MKQRGGSPPPAGLGAASADPIAVGRMIWPARMTAELGSMTAAAQHRVQPADAARWRAASHKSSTERETTGPGSHISGDRVVHHHGQNQPDQPTNDYRRRTRGTYHGISRSI